jgi:hypothetical protein
MLKIESTEVQQLLDESLFKVQLKPLLNKDRSKSDFVKIIDENGEILSVRGTGYKLVQNIDIMNAIENAFDGIDIVLSSVKMFKKKRTFYTFTLPEAKVEMAEGDEVSVRIIIQNSYDGTKKLTLIAGAFRFVCSNGMVIGDQFLEVANVHLKSNKGLIELEEPILKMVEKTKEVLETRVKKLMDIPITEDSFLEFLELFPVKYHEDVMVEFTTVKTFYDLMNLGTNILTHIADEEIESNTILENTLINSIMKMAGV